MPCPFRQGLTLLRTGLTDDSYSERTKEGPVCLVDKARQVQDVHKATTFLTCIRLLHDATANMPIAGSNGMFKDLEKEIDISLQREAIKDGRVPLATLGLPQPPSPGQENPINVAQIPWKVARDVKRSLGPLAIVPNVPGNPLGPTAYVTGLGPWWEVLQNKFDEFPDRGSQYVEMLHKALLTCTDMGFGEMNQGWHRKTEAVAKAKTNQASNIAAAQARTVRRSIRRFLSYPVNSDAELGELKARLLTSGAATLQSDLVVGGRKLAAGSTINSWSKDADTSYVGCSDDLPDKHVPGMRVCILGSGEVDIMDQMKFVVMNLLLDIMFSETSDWDGPKSRDFLEGMVNSVALTGAQNPIDADPQASTPGDPGYEEWKRLNDKLNAETPRWHGVIAERVREAKQGFTKGQTPRNIVEELIAMQYDEQNKSRCLSDYEILAISVNFLSAGVDATVVLIPWIFTFLLNNPDVHKRLVEEIDQVLPPDAPFPTKADIEKLPFLGKVVKETIRIRPTIPVTFRFTRASPVELLGPGGVRYELPPFTRVACCHMEVNHDPNTFQGPPPANPLGSPERPEAFLPDRWPHGAQPGNQEIHSFGGGQRMCIGYQIAWDNTMLMMAHLLQNFSFEGIGAPPSVEPDDGFIIAPREHFMMRATLRDSPENGRHCKAAFVRSVSLKFDPQNRPKKRPKKEDQPVLGGSGKTVLVYFASQSGNAECFAESVAAAAKSKGLCPKMCNLRDFDPAQGLPTEHFSLFIISTYGNGNPPSNAIPFHDWLATSEDKIESLKYSVFANGNSEYALFNQFGKQVDKHLSDKGGKTMVEMVVGDCSQQKGGRAALDIRFGEWLDNIWAIEELGAAQDSIPPEPVRVQQLPGKDLPAQVRGAKLVTRNLIGAMMMEVIYELDEDIQGGAYEPGDQLAIFPTNAPDVVRELASVLGGPSVTLDSIISAEFGILAIKLGLPPGVLDGDRAFFYGASSRLEHGKAYAVKLGADPLQLQLLSEASPGRQSSLVVFSPEDDLVYGLLEFPGKKSNRFLGQEDEDLDLPITWDGRAVTTLRRFLTEEVDLTSTDPSLRKKQLLQDISHFAQSDTDFKALKQEVNEVHLFKHRQELGRWNLIALKKDFPSLRIPIDVALQLLPKQLKTRPRPYSIASSPTALADVAAQGRQRVRLIVSVDRRLLREGVNFVGFCSNWMKSVPIGTRVHAQVLKPTEQSAFRARPGPVVLVGQGSGLAPFLGIVEERMVLGIKDACHVVYGCKNEDDFFMMDTWTKAKSEGYLSAPDEHGLHIAFSRKADAPKQYVQDKVWEQADHVKSVLASGGRFFVCGGTRMGADMAKTVEKVLSDGVYKEHCDETGEISLDLTHMPGGHGLCDGGTVRFVGSSKVINAMTDYYVQRVADDKIILFSDASLSETSRVIPSGKIQGTFWATAKLDNCEETTGVITVRGVHSFTDQSVVTFAGRNEEYFVRRLSRSTFTAHRSATRDAASRITAPSLESTTAAAGSFESESFKQLSDAGRYIPELWG